MNYQYIPYSLILFRFICALIILSLAYYVGVKAANPILWLMYFGLISDILDGMIARYTGGQTALMRRLDSQTDMVFWVSIGIGAWMLNPQPIREHQTLITMIFIMEGLCYLISIVKFGKETCTHAWLSKFWGLTLLAAFTQLIGFNKAGFWFYLSIYMGLISHFDRILITLILPKWTHDIPSAYHAWLIRKGISFKKHKLFNG